MKPTENIGKGTAQTPQPEIATIQVNSAAQVIRQVMRSQGEGSVRMSAQAVNTAYSISTNRRIEGLSQLAQQRAKSTVKFG